MAEKDEKQNIENTDSESYKESESSTKNVAEILATDNEDESLRKYKESLLGAAAHGDMGNTDDPRRIIVTEFRVVFEDELMPDIVHNLDTEEGIAKLQSEGISIKEGSKYKFRVSFRVQHDIVAGLKFTTRLKKAVFSDEDSVMIGSYPPASTPHVFEFPRHNYSEAPKGMLFRGKYAARNQFIDSDKVNHLEYEYFVTITK